jgi:hypothetical protein
LCAGQIPLTYLSSSRPNVIVGVSLKPLRSSQPGYSRILARNGEQNVTSSVGVLDLICLALSAQDQ